MAKLRITKNQQLVQEMTLDPGQTYLGGRAEACQIKMDAEPGISRQHFQISCRDQKWTLEVLSKYGELYFNEEKAPTQFELTDGLIFHVPPYEFTFGEGGIQQAASLSESMSADPAEKTTVAVLPSTTYLKLVDNKGAVRQLFRLEGEAWVAGRDVTCSIFIDNPRVSRKQFEIYREEQKYYIRDLGSANGTLVNGHQISSTDWTQLQSADVITVVDWTLHFEVHDAQFKQRLEQVSPNSEAEEFLNPESEHPPGSEDEFLPTNYVPIPEQEQNMYYPAPLPGDQNTPLSVPFPAYQTPSTPQSGQPQGAQSTSFFQMKLLELKSKLNPVRVVIILIILGALIYGLLPDGSSQKGSGKISKSKTPFDSLSPEDQQYVIQCYNAAEQFLQQQLFQNALDEIIKLESKVKYYKDSKAIKETAQSALATIQLQREEEKTLREKAEIEEKIQKQVAECEKIMNPDTITLQLLDQCLSPVLPLSPEHPQIVSMKKRAENMIAEREIRKAKDAEYNEGVLRLKQMYEKANAFEKGDKLKEAIRGYEQVVASSFGDPTGLKRKAKKKITFLLKKIEEDQKAYLSKADQLMKENKFRDAILYLQKVLELNTDSEPVKLKLNTARIELHKQMQIIFQDSILEESVGEVEAAKQKWKKIMEQSLPNEEYFEKARLKLRKYGVI